MTVPSLLNYESLTNLSNLVVDHARQFCILYKYYSIIQLSYIHAHAPDAHRSYSIPLRSIVMVALTGSLFVS